MVAAGVPGFFGKLPSRGDFVSRRLAADFVERWDGWLQSGVAASQAALGSRWLGIYLTSPIWRFALAPGVCGQQGHIGVVIPSVDKVGRYYPLAAAAPCESPLALAPVLDGWYEEVEKLLLSTLDEAPLDLEALDERLERLAAAGGASVNGLGSLFDGAAGAGALWHCGTPDGDGLRDLLLPLGFEAFARLGTRCLWWTQGSELVEPCVLVSSQLPAPEAFIAMLDGRWGERGWVTGAYRREAHAATVSRGERSFAPLGDLAAGRSAAGREVRSAAVTDVGRTRAVNEDSYASRDDAGTWIVADGLGGHQAGEIASRMVASVIAQLDVAAALDERIDSLVRGFHVVNGCLQVLAERDDAVALAASTVVALIIDGDAAAWIWAGDSRLYRLRGGELEQLSRDHSEAADGTIDRHVVTRAVGGDGDLELDIGRADVRDGDRFMLCTDGLYAEVTAEEIVDAMSLADAEEGCTRLKEAVLRGEARDNLTGIIVHVGGAAAEARRFA